MQRQRPWQKQTLQGYAHPSRKQKNKWIPLLLLLGILVILLALFIGVLSRTLFEQANQTKRASTATTPVSKVTYQTPTYSAVKGMWLGANESIWVQTLGEPISRQTMGNVTILSMPLTHTQGIGTFYLEESINTHTIQAIAIIAPSSWNRQDGGNLCSSSAGENVNLGPLAPLERVGTGFSQTLMVVGSSVQGSMSVFYFQNNPQAIKACTASLGSHVSEAYLPPL